MTIYVLHFVMYLSVLVQEQCEHEENERLTCNRSRSRVIGFPEPPTNIRQFISVCLNLRIFIIELWTTKAFSLNRLEELLLGPKSPTALLLVFACLSF